MNGLISDKLNGPWRITFDTNLDLCNLRCIMCEEFSIYNSNKLKNNRIMDFNIIKKVVESTAGFGLKEIIPSTMGEPLLYPDFKKIIELVKNHNLKLNLTTNGTFPKLGPEKWGELLLPITSDIKISINGASKNTAERIMKGINYEKQIENISKIVKLRDKINKSGINNPRITFQVTYMESNLEELPGLLKMAIEMGIDRLKGHHLWITWPELETESLRRNVSSIEKWNNTVDELNEIADGNIIAIDNVYKIPIEGKNNIVPNNWICPFLGREAWIAWDGTFNVCCSPDNLRKTLGDFGNVNKNNFQDLWESNDYSHLIKNWGNYHVCQKCNMRKPIVDVRRPSSGKIC